MNGMVKHPSGVRKDLETRFILQFATGTRPFRIRTVIFSTEQAFNAIARGNSHPGQRHHFTFTSHRMTNFTKERSRPSEVRCASQ